MRNWGFPVLRLKDSPSIISANCYLIAFLTFDFISESIVVLIRVSSVLPLEDMAF
jgi:hypothetical protein